MGLRPFGGFVLFPGAVSVRLVGAANAGCVQVDDHPQIIDHSDVMSPTGDRPLDMASSLQVHVPMRSAIAPTPNL
ncbi:hypothetical protein PSP31121_00576 [Pandoraea sputorum]|uniref:Uncharacterized protein n=1 Tax=Pandoraea sputorum TaxID=93222 RepID=A0A5E5API6_9BURK|nr:hypothetical protein PSP31121_00576 [Pandoraea sputorum]